MESTNRIFFNFLLVLLNTLQIYSDLTRHHNYDLLHNRHCGFSESSRIIGGEDAEMGQYPWMALLAYVNVKKGETVYYCGGAVISRRYIITAAHCVHYHRIKSLMVLLGEYKLDVCIKGEY
ncbi:phenoloxidase-activating factor 3-like [Macrosteles quadrilineatus]|uniref:phenoloxidase-activating factor 3-like n=1 Tax=Macrosteles quadrilineatus TaxID=74068 RepID=UPI0023E11124|nr:phenoloxidase-activating factor 3-like [Macrosteles quadrilineatus]